MSTEICFVDGNFRGQLLGFIHTRTGANPELLDPGSCMGIWIDGVLAAGVIYSNFQKLAHGSFIELTVASDSPHWLNRKVLRAIFEFPFEHLKVTRLQTMCHRKNKRARRLTTGLGFKEEGIARCAWDGRADAVLHSMTRHEWKVMRERFRL